MRLRIAKLASRPTYHRLRRVPGLGRMILRAFDVALKGRPSITTQVLTGPLAGMTFELDPRVQLDLVVGRYEDRIQDVIQEELTEGDVAFDVGAHFGYLTLVMAVTVGKDGRVVSFEPDPTARRVLRRNIARNDGRVPATIITASDAVGAGHGKTSFSSGSQTTRGHLDPAGELTVGVTTIDHAASRYGSPRLVKIDVEGAELDVLEGAFDTLATGRSTFVVETHSRPLAEGCKRILERHAYTIESIVQPGRAERYLVARPAA